MRPASLFATLAFPLVCASAAAADPVVQTWSYSFTGFQHVQSGTFDPALTVAGTFSGVDLNADNTIDKSELTVLMLRGFDFIACGTESYFTCSLEAFSFTPGSPLTLVATWAAEAPDFSSLSGGSFTSGDRWRLFSNGTFGERDDTWLWTANTAEVVSVVPEPSLLGMLAAGLAVLGLAVPRHREYGDIPRIC